MYTLLCLHAVIITAIADADSVTIIAVIILLFCFELPGMFIILTHLYTKCFSPTKIQMLAAVVILQLLYWLVRMRCCDCMLS
jgi:hypothetical protein